MQGLQNIGATCAVNSLIQIICRTSKLRDTLLLVDLPEKSLGDELKNILHLMHVQDKSLIPHRFINSLYKSLDGIFRRGEQLDIGELWTFMFDKIAEEISTPYTIEPTDDRLMNESNNILSRFNNNKSCEWLRSSQGVLVNIINCKNCNATFHNFEPFTSISLDIVNNNVPSIIDMLKDYLCMEERLADEWKCDKCNTCSNYSKTVKLWKAPQVFIFVIKRFIDSTKKDVRHIKINKSLCFAPNSILGDKIEKKYNLSGMGMHYGVLQGGHYTAMCHIGNGTFLHYDDLDVTNVTKDDTNKIDGILEKNNSAYIIVYELI